MTPEQERKLAELHDFWFAPRGPKTPSRAEQNDEVFEAVRAGKLGARAVLWLAGFVAACAALWASLKGGL